MAGNDAASKRVVDTGDAGMNNILNLLNTIAGQDVTTKQTSDVNPLRDVMAQISASEGTQGQALLNSIFQQAAGRVPQLMGNTFNATGSRSPNGQMAGTLQKLMADITVQAQAQMAQQQQARQAMLLQGAGQIAGANRTTQQQQRSGASGVLQNVGKVLGGAKMLRDVTGIDLAKKGKDLLTTLIAGSSSAAFPSAAIGDVGPGGLFGASPYQQSLSGVTSTQAGSLQDMLQFFSAADSPTSETPAIFGQETFSLGTPEQTSPGVAMYVPSGEMFSLGDASNTVPNDFASFASNVDPNAANMSGANTNFSTGGSEAAAPADSTLGDLATAYKVSQYTFNPNARKDIFDFSDGNFVDDVGDITDAAAIVYPPLAAVRPAMNATVAAGSSLDNFVHDPGQWFQDLVSGDEPLTESVVNSVVGIGDAIGNGFENLVNGVENFGDDVGDFFGDVFGW